ncbi:unnamed protein product [Caenorhabditis auriculariae]|uniref:Uncharacterized protein n=1 Tax=Caenorhabditis auriculariae TaxID=2777116 RepID=A0A8S1GSY6_9PELO|nr:unnamed protein product [Caenorhabditis auriculariae]
MSKDPYKVVCDSKEATPYQETFAEHQLSLCLILVIQNSNDSFEVFSVTLKTPTPYHETSAEHQLGPWSPFNSATFEKQRRMCFIAWEDLVPGAATQASPPHWKIDPRRFGTKEGRKENKLEGNKSTGGTPWHRPFFRVLFTGVFTPVVPCVLMAFVWFAV